ncbi:hypothetical protein ABPG77_001167 [Micractinium sp. CCAP 211/92]
MEMRELHGEVARLQALGLAFSDVKAEIGRVVAAQQACRNALAAAKAASSGSSGSDSEGNAPAKQEQECWMLRPGGVWLRLPAARAEVVLRAESQALGTRLEALFARQQAALAQLEREGLGPEHFRLAG